MNYQWFPGHMTKAFRMMQEDIKLIDLVIELLDIVEIHYDMLDVVVVIKSRTLYHHIIKIFDKAEQNFGNKRSN